MYKKQEKKKTFLELNPKRKEEKQTKLSIKSYIKSSRRFKGDNFAAHCHWSQLDAVSF